MKTDDFSTSTPVKMISKVNGNKNEYRSLCDINDMMDLKEYIRTTEINQQKSLQLMKDNYDKLILENEKLNQQVNELSIKVNTFERINESIKNTDDKCMKLENQIKKLSEFRSHKPVTDSSESSLKPLIIKNNNVLKNHFDSKIDKLITEISNLGVRLQAEKYEDVSESDSNVSKEFSMKDESFSKSKCDASKAAHKADDNVEDTFKPTVTTKSVPTFDVLNPKLDSQICNKNVDQSVSLSINSGSNTLFSSVNPSKSLNIDPNNATISQSKPVISSVTTNETFGNSTKLPFSNFDSKSAHFNIFGQVPSTEQNLKDSKPLSSLIGNSENQLVFGSTFMNDKVGYGETKSIFGSLNNTKQDGDNANFYKNLGTADFGFGSSTEVKWESGGKLFQNNKPNENNDDKDESANLEEECGAHFEPIVEMPPLVHQPKDEDTSDVLFKNRCKLFRFVDNEWKERGLGDIKIMKPKNPSSNMPPRLLMRREQVGKICCNHSITKMVPALKKMTEKSYCWFAKDFSDNEPKNEQFAIRFGKEAVMDQFKKTIEELQKDMSE